VTAAAAFQRPYPAAITTPPIGTPRAICMWWETLQVRSSCCSMGASFIIGLEVEKLACSTLAGPHRICDANIPILRNKLIAIAVVFQHLIIGCSNLSRKLLQVMSTSTTLMRHGTSCGGDRGSLYSQRFGPESAIYAMYVTKLPMVLPHCELLLVM